MEFYETQKGSAGDKIVESGKFLLTFTDINGNFTVKIPNEVVKNAKDGDVLGGSLKM